jgi:hypothetical protein
LNRPEEGAVLDRRTLNRSLLARQFLLERTDAPAVDVVERLVGIQAQIPLDRTSPSGLVFAFSTRTRSGRSWLSGSSFE